MRIRAALALVVALVALAGCGGSSTSSVPAPTSTPAAAGYSDPAALYAAIEKAGAPSVQDLRVGRFLPDSLPEAHAMRGTFMAAISSDRYNLYLSDGTPADTIIAAVFPDAAARKLGVPFGRRLADALDRPSVWQLQGPNWLVWSVDEQALRSIQGAIGGELSPTPTITASPGPSA